MLIVLVDVPVRVNGLPAHNVVGAAVAVTADGIVLITTAGVTADVLPQILVAVSV